MGWFEIFALSGAVTFIAHLSVKNFFLATLCSAAVIAIFIMGYSYFYSNSGDIMGGLVLFMIFAVAAGFSVVFGVLIRVLRAVVPKEEKQR